MGAINNTNLIPYDVITKPVFTSGEQALFENVNSWAVQNTGNTVVTVNGKTLLPAPAAGLSGESFGVSGNLGEVYNRRYVTIQFQAGGNPQVELSQKYYIKPF